MTSLACWLRRFRFSSLCDANFLRDSTESKQKQFSVEPLNGNRYQAVSVLRISRHKRSVLHLDDFVSHRIQHQLDRGMKFECEHDNGQGNSLTPLSGRHH
jgi:hypothetical protein